MTDLVRFETSNSSLSEDGFVCATELKDLLCNEGCKSFKVYVDLKNKELAIEVTSSCAKQVETTLQRNQVPFTLVAFKYETFITGIPPMWNDAETSARLEGVFGVPVMAITLFPYHDRNSRRLHSGGGKAVFNFPDVTSRQDFHQNLVATDGQGFDFELSEFLGDKGRLRVWDNDYKIKKRAGKHTNKNFSRLAPRPPATQSKVDNVENSSRLSESFSLGSQVTKSLVDVDETFTDVNTELDLVDNLNGISNVQRSNPSVENQLFEQKVQPNIDAPPNKDEKMSDKVPPQIQSHLNDPDDLERTPSKLSPALRDQLRKITSQLTGMMKTIPSTDSEAVSTVSSTIQQQDTKRHRDRSKTSEKRSRPKKKKLKTQSNGAPSTEKVLPP